MADDNKDTSADLGGLHIPSISGEAKSDSATVADISASAEHVRQRKQRSDAGKPRGSRTKDGGASVQTLSQVQFAQLYAPQIWEKALCAPADAMAAITGRKHWQISEKEREALGVTGSIAAQCFAVSDPKYLALSIALITILDVYGIRIALELADRKREAEEKRRKASEGSQDRVAGR